MSDVEDTPRAEKPGNGEVKGHGPARLAALVIAVSFCSLFLEMLYPKIFYFVKVMPGFEMVLVAVNMLGMGLGGLFSFYFRGSSRWILISASLFGPVVAASFLACISLESHLLIILALSVPFFFAAVAVSQSFILGRPSLVYTGSLAGSGLGVLAIFFLMRPLGGEGSILVACCIACLAGAIISLPGRFPINRYIGIGLAVFFAALLVFHLQTDRLNLIRVFPRKFDYPDRPAQVGSDAVRLPGAELLASRWSLITRLDIIKVEHSQMLMCFPKGLDGKPQSPALDELRESYWTDINLYYNNEAFTAMAQKPEMESYIPYVLLDRPSVLVIGTGGGIDLAKAFGANAKRVVGVEINPDTVDLMKNRFAQISANLYNRAEIYTMDGRTFVRRSSEKFDLINLVFAELYIAFPNSQVFIENYLYTAEAFDEYIEHLSDNGFMYITKPLAVGDGRLMDQMMRIFATSYEALERAGVKEPWKNIWFSGMDCDVDYIKGGQLLVKKSPLTEKELDTLRKLTVEPFYTIFDPGTDPAEVHNEVGNYISAKDRAAFYKSYPKDVRPCTDDKPFFYVFDKGLKTHRRFYGIFLIAGTALNFIPILITLLITGRFKNKGYPLALALFALLGAAYMLTQTVLVQKFNVFLGSPTHSLAVVIGGYLIFGAAGSWISGRISQSAIKLAAVLIPAAMIAAYFIMPQLIDAFFGTHIALRITAAAAFIAPLAVLLGIPFPAALDIAKARFGDRDAALLYAVDAALSVFAVVTSIILSIMLGFNAVFMIAAALYLIMAVTLVIWMKK